MIPERYFCTRRMVINSPGSRIWLRGGGGGAGGFYGRGGTLTMNACDARDGYERRGGGWGGGAVRFRPDTKSGGGGGGVLSASGPIRKVGRGGGGGLLAVR